MITDLTGLPPALRQQLSTQLMKGERLLYAGRPAFGRTFAAHLAIIGFTLFWCSLCLPIAYLAWANVLGFAPPLKGKPPTGGLAWFIAVFMVPFALIGLMLLYGTLHSLLRARKTVHAVTDSRILDVSGGRRPIAESYNAQQLNFVKRHDARNGRGSLDIAYGVERDSDGDSRPLVTRWHGIPDVRRAETAILELMRRRR